MSANIPNDPQAIQRFFTSRDNNANSASYVGQEQRLWYDPVTNAIYVSDGNTAGGIIVGTGGGGNGVPGGPTNSVQYNAGGGNFGGTANVVVNGADLQVVGNLVANVITNNGTGNIYFTGNLLPTAVNYTLGTLDVPWGNAFFGPRSVTILDDTGNIGNTVTIENIAANITMGTAGFDIVKLGTTDSIFRIEALTGQIISAANTIIINTTNSSDVASGSLQTAGGAGIAQDLYVGGNIYGNGVTVGGSVLVQDGNQNNIIELQTDGNIVFNGGSTLNLNGGFHVSSVGINNGDSNVVNYVGGAFVYGPALKDYAGNIGANKITATGNITISTNSTGLIFSDTTFQTTAYVVVSAPATSSGKTGDRSGMVAYSNAFFYYCTANYTTGGIQIWQRIAKDATAW